MTNETLLTMFQEFPKISRLNRDCVITEKLDGTNACVSITNDGDLITQSRNRIITPEDDNYGFARWAQGHKDELLKLGPGRHFGEWWGPGIGRGYGVREKTFSLFNVGVWGDGVPTEAAKVVPVIVRGLFKTSLVEAALTNLTLQGSYASPGFMRPEGIVIFHEAGRHMYKVTLEKDEKPKGAE